MKKILYKIKCLKNINYKSFFEVISKINKKTKISKIYLFFDMIICSIIYGAGYNDYQEFEFYNLNNTERKTYLNRVKNNLIVNKYNDKNYIYLFDNKIEFNKIFNKYLKREWLYLNNNYDEFNNFCSDKKEIIVKPIDSCGGVGVELIKINKNNIKETYDKLIKNEQLLVEEKIIQNKTMSKLNKSSVNTLRIVTFYDGINSHVLNIVLKIGNGGVTDNFSSGSMYTFIKDGKIYVPAIDKEDNIFYKHPKSDIDLVGYEIKDIDKCIKMAKDCSKMIKEVKYIGWDVAIKEDGPVLIEGNCYPGVYQIKPSFVKEKKGLVPIYEEIMNIKIDKL